MIDGDGVGFDGGGAREPSRRTELVDVQSVRVLGFGVFAGELVREGGEAAQGGAHLEEVLAPRPMLELRKERLSGSRRTYTVTSSRYASRAQNSV